MTMMQPPEVRTRVRIEMHGGKLRNTEGSSVDFASLTVGSWVQQYHGPTEDNPDGWSQLMEVVTTPTALGVHGNFFVLADLASTMQGPSSNI